MSENDLLERFKNLPPEKRQLVLEKLRQKQGTKAGTENLASRISRVPRDQAIPLSVAQQRIWFLDRLEGGSAAYNMPAALRLTGKLNVGALGRALLEIIRRHESLRTSFKLLDGSPVQVIHGPPVGEILPIVDLQSLSEEEQKKEVTRLAKEEAEHPFNLSQGILLRTTLLRLSVEHCILLLNMHHIISDGWSVANFTRELATLYDAFSQGKPSPLPELPIQYADFACWQRQWLKGEVLEGQLNYWKQQLAGLPPLLELPTDRLRPPVQTFRGSLKSFQLSRELTQQIEKLSQQSGTTPYMILLAALAILLSRYSRQEDIAIGSPIANRRQVEIEPLIGFFLNTLVMRVRLEDNATFSELLKQVQQIALNAYAYQDVPFEYLTESLQPERNPSHSPWFQVLFVFQNMPKYNFKLPGLSVESQEIENDTSKFDLSLYMEEHQSQFIGTWEYNTDLFDPETIDRLNEHFEILLQGIVANPHRSIAQLPLLTKPERHQLLVEWNNTQTTTLDEACVHQLFEKQVAQTPDAIAVEFKGDFLTYGELNRRANQLARYLQKLGVGQEVLVGICVERSIEMIVGLLGILKAGGAYVPLDPAYPQERLSYILSDAQVSVLLTQKQLTENLTSKGAHIVDLKQEWQLIAQESIDNLNGGSKPENLAYIIYTSGSTGNPKGVMIEHRSLVNFTLAAIEEYGFTNSDRVLQFASISFDTAAEEIYPSLSCGATLVLRTDEILASLPTFLQKCRDWELTVLDLPTAYWHQLMAELATADFSFPESVRIVIIGGEKALPDPLKSWQQQGDKRPQLINTYGPTEATVVATAYKLPATSTEADTGLIELPIGRSLPNVQVYVLDRYQQIVPIGVPGELHIGGCSLARGYLNRLELTEKAFIFHEELGSRLYKTGDLVRYLADGNLEYFGRIDNQVKIRGFRIELGEIEAVLGTHPDVREAVVVLRQDLPGDNRLVAYVVSNLRTERVPYHTDCRLKWEGQSIELRSEDFSLKGIGLIGVSGTWDRGKEVHLLLQLPGEPGKRLLKGSIAWHEGQEVGIEFLLEPAEKEAVKAGFNYLLESEDLSYMWQRTVTKSLRDYLSRKLPDYMVPSTFVLLEEIPLTPNRKVDRRALPAPDISHRDKEDNLVAPRDALELQLAQIWQEILGVDNIGVQDNFFELGGNSLLAIRLMAQMEQFGQNLPLATLLQNPTIENLAGLLRQENGSHFASLVPIQPSGSQQPLFCIHPGGGNVLCYFDLSRELGTNQPVYGLQSVGLNGEAKPLTCIEEMANHYLREIQSVQPQSPYRLAGWSFGGLVAYEIARQLQAKGQQVAFLGLLDTYEPSVAPLEPQDDAALLVLMFAGLIALSEDYLRQFDLEGKLQYIVDQGKKADFFPPDYGLKQLRWLMQIYKSNQQAERQYRPQPYGGCLSLFFGSEDTLATPDDSTMGWSKLVRGGVEIYAVPGTHQTMVQKPHVHELAKQLKTNLDRI